MLRNKYRKTNTATLSFRIRNNFKRLPNRFSKPQDILSDNDDGEIMLQEDSNDNNVDSEDHNNYEDSDNDDDNVDGKDHNYEDSNNDELRSNNDEENDATPLENEENDYAMFLES